MKIYKLRKDNWKYEIPEKSSHYSFYDLQDYINKSGVKKALKERKKYKRPNDFILILKFLAFYYLLIGFIILLGKLGL